MLILLMMDIMMDPAICLHEIKRTTRPFDSKAVSRNQRILDQGLRAKAKRDFFKSSWMVVRDE